MFTPSSLPPRKFIARSRQSGFSLVEVVLAVGVIAFAFVAILGLLPAGLQQFRQAMDNSVAAQISQRIILEAQQSDFDVLTNTAQGQSQLRQSSSLTPFQMRSYAASDTSKNNPMTVRYFDEQGNEVIPQSSTPTAKELSTIIYHVNARIVPGTSLPGSVTGNMDLGTSGAGVSLATILVQVAFNPSGKPLKVDSNLMFDLTQNKGLPVRNFNAQIGRND